MLVSTVKDCLEKELKKYKERLLKAIPEPTPITVDSFDNIDVFWKVITLYDKMVWYLYDLENFDESKKRKFVDMIIKSSEKYKDFLYMNGIEDTRNVKALFGITEKTSYERSFKKILVKCKIILDSYTYKLKIILSRFESMCDILD